MENSNIQNKEKLCKFLGRFFNINGVKEEDNFFEKGFVNSLFYMQLVMFIESEFNISIQPEDLDIKNFNSVNNIIEFIENKTNIKAG